MDGVSKFELVDLLAAVETFLIDNENEWIQKNIVTVHKYAASTVSLDKLLAYCNQIMVSHPDVIFKSNDLASLPKETLITILKSDELTMDEDDIWMSVIQWAAKQVSESELGSDLDNWSFNDINIIADFIPHIHIRFFNMSLDKIALYYELLPRKLGRDLLNFQAGKNYNPNTCMPPPRTGQGHDIDSVIINKKQAVWISSKIVESRRQLQENQKISEHYKFTLLYRRSRDGNTVAKFRELCNNKGPTIAVGKVLGTEEILGGYNPFAWDSRNNYADTKESFIFALDKNVDNSIVSFCGNNGLNAISDFDYSFPGFGHGSNDLYFGGKYMPLAMKVTYQVAIRNSSDRFEWDDWEVFLVSKF